MLKLSVLSLVLLASIPAWSQVEPSATGGSVNPDDDQRMVLPPPISGGDFPTIVGSEERSNYLEGGVIFTAAYNDNVLPDGTPTPISDWSYFVFPTISLEQKTARQSRSFNYSPGFKFYQDTTALNAVDQNANADYQYRISPRATLNLHDTFQQNSNIYDQPYGLAGAVSGSTQGPVAGVIAPFANQLVNTARASFSYQFALNGMIGGGGTTSLLDYPDPKQVPGLFNYKSGGGMGFYSRRISRNQYFGGIYQYSIFVTNPIDSTIQTNNMSAFYTIYWHKSLTVSLIAGPQYYKATQTAAATSSAWSPAVTASLGWQGYRTNFAASYSRSVSAGGGLLGAYNSNSGNADARWQLAHTWIAGVHGSYTIIKNATPQLSASYPGGHTILGSASLQHSFGDHFRAEAGYDRLHQSYNTVALISSSPDSNREYVSISYQFAKSLEK